MARLILGEENSCYVCGATQSLERHHVFGGTRRRISEKYGACVMLCHEHHQGKYGAHGIGRLDYWLKAEAQEKIMEREGWDIPKFIQVFGKNYL